MSTSARIGLLLAAWMSLTLLGLGFILCAAYVGDSGCRQEREAYEMYEAYQASTTCRLCGQRMPSGNLWKTPPPARASPLGWSKKEWDAWAWDPDTTSVSGLKRPPRKPGSARLPAVPRYCAECIQCMSHGRTPTLAPRRGPSEQ